MKVLAAAVEAQRTGRAAALATIIAVEGSAPRHSGARMLVYDDGSIVGTIGGGTMEYKVIEAAVEAIRCGAPARFSVHLTRDLGMCCGGAMEAYIEPLQELQSLVIFGAGHVGTAVAHMAVDIGFAITVVDERDEFADPSRFPSGVTVLDTDPRRCLDTLPWGPHSYHLIVTHSHQLDQDLVQECLVRPLAWLGMIGSRAKVAKFFVRLRAAGVDPALFSKLSAPVGLDIGAETPEEIGVSILAELVRVRRGALQNPVPLSEHPIKARGGDGRAHPPALAAITPTEP